VFVQGLTALNAVMDKAIAHMAERKIDPAALLTYRLYPDMLPFKRQVQVACEFAKGGVGRLAGDESMPTYDNSEASFEDLKGRIAATIAYVQSIDASRLEGAEDRTVTLTRGETVQTFKGGEYLLGQSMPNFYFHLTTAYAILRHNGVEIGKKDFLGTR
jgi:hypothetical protein